MASSQALHPTYPVERFPGSLIAPRPAAQRHALVALAVACLVLSIVLQPIRSGTGRAVTAGALAGNSPKRRASFAPPAAARGPVSAALGKDSPAYRVTAAASGYRAASPGQRLTLGFTRSGVSVRTGQGRLGLALREIGYGTRLHSVGGSLPKSCGEPGFIRSRRWGAGVV